MSIRPITDTLRYIGGGIFIDMASDKMNELVAAVDARLRYRQREGKLTFYYELIRQDKVLEAATETIIKTIRETTGNPFFFGDPFAS